MAVYNEYAMQIQRFCRDQGQQYLDPGDLTSYINRARREVAGRTQCIRVLTPISASVVSATVTDGGTGYADATTTCAISAPDFPSGALPNPLGLQAEALPIIVGGVITAINISVGGYGYFEPTITIEDSSGAGSGAEATLTVSPINLLNEGQEVYNFSDLNLSMFPGVGEILQVKSVSLIYSNYRYSLPVYSFSVYQSRIRQYSAIYQYVPTFAAQFGQGANGSLYFFPLPSQSYQQEWDCLCLPQDMVDDGSYEVIPNMWRDAVPMYGAFLAMAELQNYNASRFYEAMYEKYISRFSTYARSGRRVNPNGRW